MDVNGKCKETTEGLAGLAGRTAGLSATEKCNVLQEQ